MDVRETQLEVIEAAGGIIECVTSEGPLVAVAYRERYGGEWGLPKGKRQAGDSWQETALREVREATGLAPDIVAVAVATAYLAEGVPKIVLYWRMLVDRATEPFVPNEEVTKLVWLTPAQAVERLTHREEADFVRRIFEHSGELNAGGGARPSSELFKQTVLRPTGWLSASRYHESTGASLVHDATQRNRPDL